MLMRPACSPRHLQLEFQNSVNQHQSFVFYPALSFKRVFGRTLRLCGPTPFWGAFWVGHPAEARKWVNEGAHRTGGPPEVEEP